MLNQNQMNVINANVELFKKYDRKMSATAIRLYAIAIENYKHLSALVEAYSSDELTAYCNDFNNDVIALLQSRDSFEKLTIENDFINALTDALSQFASVEQENDDVFDLFSLDEKEIETIDQIVVEENKILTIETHRVYNSNQVIECILINEDTFTKTFICKDESRLTCFEVSVSDFNCTIEQIKTLIIDCYDNNNYKNASLMNFELAKIKAK